MSGKFFADHILGPDTHTNRPAATDVPYGALYECTTHNKIYKNNAGTWIDWVTLAGAAALPAGGTTGQVLAKNSSTDYDANWADDTGGGGGGFPLDPASLDATYGDHFDGASLDAKWNRVGYVAGDEQYAVGGTYLQVDNGRAGGNYYWQNAPSGDFTIVMAGYVFTLAQGSGLMYGPLILDSSGNGVCGGAYVSTEGVNVFNVAAGIYGSGLQNRPLGIFTAANSGLRVWWRLRKAGTSYYCSMSLNGTAWTPETPAWTAFTATPTRIGWGAIFGTPVAFGIDFFDVQ